MKYTTAQIKLVKHIALLGSGMYAQHMTAGQKRTAEVLVEKRVLNEGFVRGGGRIYTFTMRAMDIINPNWREEEAA